MKLVLPHQLNETQQQVLDSDLSGEWSVVCAPDDAYFQAMADADATISTFWPTEAPIPEQLKLYLVPGAGYDGVAFERLPAEVWVCNVYEHEIAIAEYVLAAMLEWQIDLRGLDQRARAGDWSGTFYGASGLSLHGELYGKTLGIIGYGHIGREVAARAKAFGMEILACSRTARAGDGLVNAVAPMAGLADMLARSDFVMVACPHNEETTGLINTAQFQAMKESGVIINVARGPVIDEDALYAACAEKIIAGAVIDVWYNYPGPGENICMPANQPFHELGNVILSPHSSGMGEGLVLRRWRKMAANLNAFAAGEPLENVIRAPGAAAPE